MITDDERRRIAAALRAQQAAQFPSPEVAYDVSPSLTTWERIGGIVLDSETRAECDRLKSRDNRAQAVRSVIAGRLADLIDPGQEHFADTDKMVDRDALLELADEMDDLVKAWNERYPTNRIAAYARRIREACGEEGPCDGQH